MFVIIVYDVGEKRVAKALKTCRKYLNWVQNSVLEGEISDVNLKKLRAEWKSASILKWIPSSFTHGEPRNTRIEQ